MAPQADSGVYSSDDPCGHPDNDQLVRVMKDFTGKTVEVHAVRFRVSPDGQEIRRKTGTGAELLERANLCHDTPNLLVPNRIFCVSGLGKPLGSSTASTRTSWSLSGGHHGGGILQKSETRSQNPNTLTPHSKTRYNNVTNTDLIRISNSS